MKYRRLLLLAGLVCLAFGFGCDSKTDASDGQKATTNTTTPPADGQAGERVEDIAGADAAAAATDESGVDGSQLKQDPRFTPPKDVSAPPANATKTDRGLFYVILEEGEGDETPQPLDKVTAHITGWTTAGVMFHSSHNRGQPPSLHLQNHIEGLRLALVTMKKGEKRRLWVPEHLAAGHGLVIERQLARPGKCSLRKCSPRSMWRSMMLGLGLEEEPDLIELMLVFDVELLGFESP